MGGALDSLFYQLSQSLIGAFGTTAQVVVMPTGAYDPLTGTATVDEEPETVFSVNISPPRPYNRGLVDGDNVLDGDMSAIVPAASVGNNASMLTAGAFLRHGGIDWKIISVESVYSGNDICQYVLQLRK